MAPVASRVDCGLITTKRLPCTFPLVWEGAAPLPFRCLVDYNSGPYTSRNTISGISRHKGLPGNSPLAQIYPHNSACRLPTYSLDTSSLLTYSVSDCRIGSYLQLRALQCALRLSRTPGSSLNSRSVAGSMNAIRKQASSVRIA